MHCKYWSEAKNLEYSLSGLRECAEPRKHAYDTQVTEPGSVHEQLVDRDELGLTVPAIEIKYHYAGGTNLIHPKHVQK